MCRARAGRGDRAVQPAPETTPTSTPPPAVLIVLLASTATSLLVVVLVLASGTVLVLVVQQLLSKDLEVLVLLCGWVSGHMSTPPIVLVLVLVLVPACISTNTVLVRSFQKWWTCTTVQVLVQY
jgi:hypothetical protein